VKSLIRRLAKLEKSLQRKDSAATDAAVARVLQRLADHELDLLIGAARAYEQGRELNEAELAAAQAFADALGARTARPQSGVTGTGSVLK